MNNNTTNGDTTPPSNDKPGFVKKWLVATRPFSLSASTMPVIFGTILAITVGNVKFKFLLFLATFVGMAVLHIAANLLNDVYDFKKGIDKQVNPVSGAVVRGWISSKEALTAAWLLITLGSLIGLWITSVVGLQILWLGLAGVVIGVFYTWGPFALKYKALGDLAVFLDFGILGSLGAWTVQTGSLSLTPAIWAIPMSMLVIGILHANNWRDIKSDKDGKVHTVANILGDAGSKFYYYLLIFGPFAVVLLIIFFSRLAPTTDKMPYTFLVTFVAIPLGIKLAKKCKARKSSTNIVDFLSLDGATAQLNLLFGVLCTSALGLNALITWLTG
jgi:1,4-dihydroxy-2-naphthoate octaprenyltransferase